MNEQQRLAQVQALEILDTPAEERYDRITRVAQRMFNVPIALVSVIDANRQWFKSSVGTCLQETPRNISFCAHAILDNKTFVIEDAHLDDRFIKNSLVTEPPHIRFYAGRPIRLPATYSPETGNMGTLCILDTKPRTMSEDDLELLDDLALMIESEVHAHYAATIDDLTQISNRRGFQMLGQKSLEYCQRYDVPACLVFIDINKFKPINDTFGHPEGDYALRQFSKLLLASSRRSDVVARIGGDEFLLLLMETNSYGASSVINKFQQQLDDYNRQAERGYELKFSYGVVEYKAEKHTHIDLLLEEGDELMYKCKNES